MGFTAGLHGVETALWKGNVGYAKVLSKGDDKSTYTNLGHAEGGCVQDHCGNDVAVECLLNLLAGQLLERGDRGGDILDDCTLGLEVLRARDKLGYELVAVVFEPSFSVWREALAWWTANQEVELSGPKFQEGEDFWAGDLT